MTGSAASPTALIFPPLWDTIDMPPLGSAVLAGALRQAGLPATVVDLNLDFHDWLLSDETLQRLLRFGAGLDEAEELGWLARLCRMSPAQRSAAPERWAPLFFLAASLGMTARPLLGPGRFLAGIHSSAVRLADLTQPPGEDRVPAFWQEWMDAHVARLGALRPRLVAISINHVGQLLPAIALARSLRRAVTPPPAVIAGGPWCTLMAISNADPAPLFSVLDALGCGPGDEVLGRAAELAPALPTELPGLWRAGGPRPGLGRPVPASPDFSGLPLERYFAAGRPLLPLESSRGCWGRCRYCSDTSLNPGYRTKPLDQVIAEVAGVQERCPGAQIAFVDSVIPPRRAQALAEAIGGLATAAGRPIEWRFSMRPDAKLDAEQCRTLRSGGVSWVFIGFDAPTQKLLDEIDKRATLDGVRVLVRNLQAAGIAVGGNFILGLPGETQADRTAILDLVSDFGLDTTQVTSSLFGLVRGSWYYEHMDEMGWPEAWIDRVRANDVLTDFLPVPPVDPARRTSPSGQRARKNDS